MPITQPLTVPLWPIVVYFGAVLVVVGGMLGLSYVLGQRHTRREIDADPYESGMVPIGSARVRFDVMFYLNAMFFVLFDLETMFIVAWAVAFRESGWVGYIEMVIFILVLFAALVYLWRMGALDWRTIRERLDASASRR
jgi:NADH-quinone oxidoreductase subunit A